MKAGLYTHNGVFLSLKRREFLPYVIAEMNLTKHYAEWGHLDSAVSAE